MKLIENSFDEIHKSFDERKKTLISQLTKIGNDKKWINKLRAHNKLCFI